MLTIFADETGNQSQFQPTLVRVRESQCLHARLQMGLGWLVLLETCKYVGRRHQKLIYVRAIGPLAVRRRSPPAFYNLDLYVQCLCKRSLCKRSLSKSE